MREENASSSSSSFAPPATASPSAVDSHLVQQSSPASSGGHNPDGSQTFSAPNRTGSIALNPRSCVTCRKRKVRCDKQQPCSNCVRARIPCQFPAPGRAPRRPRKTPDGELLARLRKLEGVVKSLGATTDDENILTSSGVLDRSLNHAGSYSPSTDGHHHSDDVSGRHRMSSLDNNFGRLVLDEGKSRYVNNSFWANLSNEVEDIKAILHDESDVEHDLPTPGDSPHVSSPGLHQTFVFHHSSPEHEKGIMLPPPHIMQLYWDKFEENVDPLIKMLHLPSMRALIGSIKEDPTAIPKHHEPLVWAIFYASATSLSSEECQTIVGEQKLVVQEQLRRAVERSLAREHFLSTEEIVVLQALVLFLLSLRRNEHPRVLWSLTGLVVRIATTMGLHRDGSYFDLSLYDTEVRRRLWWQVCNLDVRLSEDHGSDPGILEHSFDTRIPLNIDDQDFQPDMPESTQDKQGVTDMTFSLIRFEVANTFRRLSYCPPNPVSFKEKWPDFSIKEKEEWIEECHRSLEEKYLRHCDMTIPMHWVIGTVARLIMAKMWLLIYQPFQRLDGGASLSQETRNRLFVTSLESIEYALLLETEVRTVKWGWLFKSYSQWHALAFLLSELCHRTKGPTVHRAWLAVDETIVEMQNRVPSHRREAVWRPLARLIAKARSARDSEMSMDNTIAPSSNPWPKQDSAHDDPWDPQNPCGSKAFGAGTGYEKAASLTNTTIDDRNCDVRPTANDLPSTSNAVGNKGSSTSTTNTSNTQSSTSTHPPAILPSHFDTNWTFSDQPANTASSTVGPEFAPSPFFANQPPVQPPSWPPQASGADSALLNDFFMGESFNNPAMRTGTTPGPSITSATVSAQPFSKDLGSLADFNVRSHGITTNTTGPFSAANGAENPMVSGADAGASEPVVPWDAWDDMVREFDMEMGTESSNGNSEQAMGVGGMGSLSSGSAATAGFAGTTKRPGPGSGDMWF